MMKTDDKNFISKQTNKKQMHTFDFCINGLLVYSHCKLEQMSQKLVNMGTDLGEVQQYDERAEVKSHNKVYRRQEYFKMWDQRRSQYST